MAILPYIEQQALYNEFQLDEPWDSPHNKALIERMPDVFACPSRRGRAGHDHLPRLHRQGAACSTEAKGASASPTITDGTSNTIAVVEAKEAVPWTKPDEACPLPTDGRRGPGPAAGLDATRAASTPRSLDGSVRFIKKTIAPATFRALLTRQGAEIINATGF